jgi:hypothetical protein
LTLVLGWIGATLVWLDLERKALPSDSADTAG